MEFRSWLQVLILQSLPGAGKSTYARKLAQEQNAIICSADDFFIVDGEYKFDRTKLGQAHGFCFRSFINHLQSQVELIIIDNTNTAPIEIAPYIQGAVAYGYDYRILYFPCDVNTSFERNIHKVPLKTIEHMQRNLEKQFPCHWKKREVIK